MYAITVGFDVAFFIDDAELLCTLTWTGPFFSTTMTRGFVVLCSITFVVHLSESIFFYELKNLSRSPVSSIIFVNQSVHLHL